MSFEADAPVREAALRILGRRAYSAEEMMEKLAGRGFSEDESYRAVLWLLDMGYLNDEKLAEDLARSYSARQYGPYRVRRELSRRLIADDVAERALESLPPAADLIDAWLRKQTMTGDRVWKRLSDALYRRGFGWDDIRDGLSRFAEDIDTEEGA